MKPAVRPPIFDHPKRVKTSEIVPKIFNTLLSSLAVLLEALRHPCTPYTLIDIFMPPSTTLQVNWLTVSLPILIGQGFPNKQSDYLVANNLVYIKSRFFHHPLKNLYTSKE